MKKHIDQLKALDYSHIYTTAVDHIIEIYEEAKKHKGGHALELGSYLGHSTLAIALAGLDVVVYDTDTTVEDKRKALLSQFKVEWNNQRSHMALQEVRTFDFIFHDSDHGDGMIPEMVELFNKVLNPGGTMVIHDAELLTMVNLTSQLESHEAKGSTDQRGRMLLTLYKK
jgi:predicted O-methyltransferase YrrM